MSIILLVYLLPILYQFTSLFSIVCIFLDIRNGTSYKNNYSTCIYLSRLHLGYKQFLHITSYLFRKFMCSISSEPNSRSIYFFFLKLLNQLSFELSCHTSMTFSTILESGVINFILYVSFLPYFKYKFKRDCFRVDFLTPDKTLRLKSNYYLS